MRPFTATASAQALGDILADHPPFARFFSIEAMPPVYSLQHGDHQRVLDTASRAKLFVHQPISGARFAPADTSNILAALSPAATSLCFPVLWFEAYCPDVQYLRLDPAKHRAPSDYHSAIMLAAYLLGRTVQDAVRSYDDRHALAPETVTRIMREAVQRLRGREEEHPVNLRVADFVEAEAVGRRLFHTLNHPSSVMLFYIADEMLRRLDLPPLGPEVRLRHHHVLSGPRMPELIAVHLALGLRFERHTQFRGIKGPSDALSFAQASFQHYSEIRLQEFVTLADLPRIFVN